VSEFFNISSLEREVHLILSSKLANNITIEDLVSHTFILWYANEDYLFESGFDNGAISHTQEEAIDHIGSLVALAESNYQSSGIYLFVTAWLLVNENRGLIRDVLKLDSESVIDFAHSRYLSVSNLNSDEAFLKIGLKGSYMFAFFDQKYIIDILNHLPSIYLVQYFRRMWITERKASYF